jgi:hypothetical protein
MVGIGLVLLVIALILAVLAALGVPSGRVNLGWASLAFFIASFLIR